MIFLLLFISAIMAGALNSVAGGGSFFTFPILLFTGMNPIMANATSTIAVWPGTLASVLAYRDEIKANKAKLPKLVASSFIGSVLGAFVLLNTPTSVFTGLIPYLLLVATLLFSFSSIITRKLKERRELGKRSLHVNPLASFFIQIVIAFYGGYFGGGMGIMMLAMLSFMGLTHIHEMNALKSTLGSVINGVAVVIFIIAGIVAWPQAIVMLTGSIIGGYFGAHYARKISPDKIRYFVIGVGCILTVYFFMKS
jgi:uncharacterized membrane protein YfcA